MPSQPVQLYQGNKKIREREETKREREKNEIIRERERKKKRGGGKIFKFNTFTGHF